MLPGIPSGRVPQPCAAGTHPAAGGWRRHPRLGDYQSHWRTVAIRPSESAVSFGPGYRAVSLALAPSTVGPCRVRHEPVGTWPSMERVLDVLSEALPYPAIHHLGLRRNSQPLRPRPRRQGIQAVSTGAQTETRGHGRRSPRPARYPQQLHRVLLDEASVFQQGKHRRSERRPTTYNTLRGLLGARRNEAGKPAVARRASHGPRKFARLARWFPPRLIARPSAGRRGA